MTIGTDESELSDVERDMARRLHGASIAIGKADAALERLPADVPACFKVNALAGRAAAGVKWLRIYFEIVEHFKSEKNARTASSTREAE